LDSAEEKLGGSGNKNINKFGLCSRCKELIYIEKESGKIILACQAFDWMGKPLPLDMGDKVVECSHFKQKGHPELWQLEKMAYIVESRREAGFKIDDEE